MLNYSITKVGDEPRVELKEVLALSGCEVSINELPAGVSVPFVHEHKQNEEFYFVLSGKGRLFIDGEEREIVAGDAFRIAPKGKRCIAAAKDSAVKFICVQTKKGSLTQWTNEDGVMSEGAKPSWL